ncbi:MAG: YceI family protein [Lewinellaceae bacterium]|nr:YceI family protein [Lewinella sp.]MCB9277483.1 YceI family protein [Lewinellaceae bacterium]
MATLKSIALISALISCLAQGQLMPAIHTSDSIYNRSYRILDESKLFLEGTSNVNEFKCSCKEDFPVATFTFENSESNLTSVRFSDTRLTLKTRSLECGNRMMNKDLQKALKAETFPNIVIQLSEANLRANTFFPDQVLAGWTPMTAQTYISIAGQTRKVRLDINVQKTGHDKYRFTASKELHMTDFGIDPPTALLGLVKVNDRITINLDLTVALMD